MKTFLLVFCLTLGSLTFAEAGETPDSNVIVTSLSQLLSGAQEKKEREALVSNLRRAAKQAPKKERAIYQKLIKAAEELDGSEAPLHRLLLAQSSAVDDVLRLYPDDLKLQATLIGSQSVLGLTMEQQAGLEEQGRALKEKAERTAQSLLLKHPKEARLRLLMGVLYARASRADLAASEFRKCTELDPSNADCRKNSENLAKTAGMPRCRNINPSLAFYIGARKEGGKFTRPVILDKIGYFISSTPVWSGSDVENISLDAREESTSLSLRLSVAGARKFEDSTASHIGQVGILMLGDQPLMAPVIKQKITGGNLMIDTGVRSPLGDGRSALKRLCSRVEASN